MKSPTPDQLSSPTPQSSQPQGRMAFLDVIRGIAALAVVIEHASEHFFPDYLAAANSHFTFGVFGVATFFLVSGFIIPVSMERHNSLLDFWKARFFRLYPMYWFSLLIPVVLSLVSSHSLAAFGPHPWRVILANTTMLQAFFGIPNVSGLYWTLNMEMIFYILCSALFVIGTLSRSLLWAWFAVVSNLLANVTLGLAFHRSLPAGRCALIVLAFFGTLLYRRYQGSLSITSILKIAPVLALSLATGFWYRFHVYPLSAGDERAFRFLGVSMSYLGAFAIFLTLYVLRNRFMPVALIWLGRISYSLYLIHGCAIALVPAGPYPGLRLLAVILLAIIFSTVTFLLIEKPGIALYHRLSGTPIRHAATSHNSSPHLAAAVRSLPHASSLSSHQ